MKKIVIVVFVFSLLLVNCKKDDNSTGYSFKDQTLFGKINGVTWNMQSGWADISVYNEDTTLRVNCYDFATNDPCSATFTGSEVSFSIPKKVGVYVLNSDINNNRSICLYDQENSMNYISSKGAVEIISISDTQVKGRIDATCNDDNTVNGNFTVNICLGK